MVRIGPAVAVAALLAFATSASAAWTPVTSGKQGNSNLVAPVRGPDGTLHVIWTREDSPSAYTLLDSALSPSGTSLGTSTIVSGWTSVNDPAAVALPNGGRRVFFAGIHSTSSDDPLVGMISDATDAGSAWPADGAVNTDPHDYGYARTPGATIAPDGTPFSAWYSTDQTVVHRGLDPSVPAVDYSTPTSNGKCCSLLQNMATDASGTVVVAWCQGSEAPGGIYVEAVNPATGLPAGQASAMPQRDPKTLCQASQRTPLAARVGGGLYTAATSGYPTAKTVYVWKVGGGVAPVATDPNGVKSPQVAADPAGRIWVGWLDRDGNVFVRRSNPATTVWGQTVKLTPPKGTVEGFELELAPQTGGADVFGRFQSTSDLQVFHTQVLPGLTVLAVGRHRTAKVTVTDAGDPVKGAKVKGGGRSGKTNAKGVVTLTYKSAKRVGLTVTKAGYTAAHASIRVR
jgi:hypothetical protein